MDYYEVSQVRCAWITVKHGEGEATVWVREDQPNHIGKVVDIATANYDKMKDSEDLDKMLCLARAIDVAHTTLLKWGNDAKETA